MMCEIEMFLGDVKDVNVMVQAEAEEGGAAAPPRTNQPQARHRLPPAGRRIAGVGQRGRSRGLPLACGGAAAGRGGRQGAALLVRRRRAARTPRPPRHALLQRSLAPAEAAWSTWERTAPPNTGVNVLGWSVVPGNSLPGGNSIVTYSTAVVACGPHGHAPPGGRPSPRRAAEAHPTFSCHGLRCHRQPLQLRTAANPSGRAARRRCMQVEAVAGSGRWVQLATSLVAIGGQVSRPGHTRWLTWSTRGGGAHAGQRAGRASAS